MVVIQSQNGFVRIIFLIVLFGLTGYLLWQKGFIEIQGISRPEKGLTQKELDNTAISPVRTPHPQASAADLSKYLTLSDVQPKIGSNDVTERFYSPDKRFYILRISISGNANGTYFAVYKSDDTFIGTFNNCLGSDLCGIAKIFHDFWIDNQTLAFSFMVNYEFSSVRLNIPTKKFSKLDNELFDFDSNGGFIKFKRDLEDVYQGSILYIPPDKGEIYVGKIRGRLNGLSPSGKYGVVLKYTDKTTDRGGPVNKVIIFPVIEKGLDKGVEMAELAYPIGGIEALVDPPMTIWSADEKKFTVKDDLVKSQEYTNPF